MRAHMITLTHEEDRKDRKRRINTPIEASQKQSAHYLSNIKENFEECNENFVISFLQGDRG